MRQPPTPTSAGTFTLADVREVIKERSQRSVDVAECDVDAVGCRSVAKEAAKKNKVTSAAPPKKIEPVAGPQRRSAVSVMDILNFDPKSNGASIPYDRSSVRKEWLENYDVLIAMRDELEARIAAHRAETFRGSDGDSTERLRLLGQHTADGAADYADIERALTFVENERGLLDEVRDAIGRIYDGTYGVCEQTDKPIDRKRLDAIPFARLSLEGQREREELKKRHAPSRSSNVALFVAGDCDGEPLIGGNDDEDD
ncbi:MAG: TraR/DksA family transcriptional regulator [Puniceicoccales bacterium]|nr:TraR/DksA family transcriptional regulator [Puniceicoccales bacterium]